MNLGITLDQRLLARVQQAVRIVSGAESRKKHAFIEKWRNKIYLCGKIKSYFFSHVQQKNDFLGVVNSNPEIFVAILNDVTIMSNHKTAEQKNKLILSFLNSIPKQTLDSVSVYLKSHRNYKPAYTQVGEKEDVSKKKIIDEFGNDHIGKNQLWEETVTTTAFMQLEEYGKAIRLKLDLWYLIIDYTEETTKKYDNIEMAWSMFSG